MHPLHNGLEPGLVTSVSDTFTGIGDIAKLDVKRSAPVKLEPEVDDTPPDHLSIGVADTRAKLEFKQHLLSAAFAPMPTEAFQGLVDSIGEIGVRNPITLFEGMVIDGWHRYLASIEAGMDCPTVELGNVDPKDFVMAQNKARRHLSQSQMAMATTAVYAWKPIGNPAFSQSGTQCPIGKTNAELSEISGVGERTIKQAKSVQTYAAPEVVEAVKRGEVGLPKAAAIARMPLDEQAAALHKPVPQPVKAAVPAAEPEPQDDGPSAEELAANAAAEAVDRELMHTLLNTDAPLAALAAENKRLKAEVAQLEQRIHGLMDEKNMAIGLVKSRDRQIAKLQKQQQVPT